MNNDKKNTEPRTIIANMDGGGYEIEISKDSQIEVLKGISQKSGKPYKMVKQEAWLHKGYGYPVRCFVPLFDSDNVLAEDNMYEEGAYFIGDLLDVGGWGDLMISRNLKLVSKVSVKNRKIA